MNKIGGKRRFQSASLALSLKFHLSELGVVVEGDSVHNWEFNF